MNEKFVLPVSIIIAGLLVGGGIYLNGRMERSAAREQASKNAQVITGGTDISNIVRPIDATDHIIGNPKARILVVEYSDTECPFCKVFHNTMLSIMDEYGAKGEVAWVYRHYPAVSLHSNAPKQAEALECAAKLGGSAKFWEYTNKIYEITPSNNGLDMTELPKVATEVGLSMTAFNTCLQSGQYASRVASDIQNAQELGAAGTPYSVIIDTKTNEYYPLEGAYPYADFKTALDLILQS